MFLYDKQASLRIVASVLVVCAGVGVATVADPQSNNNLQGLFVGLSSVSATALYQIWAGSMQKELKMSSMQLLQ
jgi:solute carrier family 35 protein E3